jgi:hypothetical protein
MESQYSHVKYFPNQEAYNKCCDYVVNICDIGVESFATRAQTMLVDHLREHFGDGIANWFRTFWTEAHGRMCLAHSWCAGYSNNMGIEVSWRDIKKLLQPNCLTRNCPVPIGAVPQLALPLHQDLSWRGAHAAHEGSRLLECIHPRSHPD